MFLFLSCWILAGVVADDPVVTHYQLKNSSLCLHVRKPPPYKGCTWRFAETAIITSSEMNPKYAAKVDYNPTNLSLCIKELTDNDAGIYTVTYSDSSFNLSSEKHRVIVQDGVPRPVIKISMAHSNLSAEFCNITVNCSIQDDWVLSFCDEDSCRTSQKSLSRVNITISTHGRTVICSGNNHVSRNKFSETVATTCFNKSNPEHKEASQPTIVIVVVVVTLCASLCAFIAFMALRLFSEYNRHRGHTSTIQLIQNQPVEEQPQPEPRVSTSSFSQAEATYENLDATQPSWTISPKDGLGSMPTQMIDTVYSVLHVPHVTPCLVEHDSCRDTKGHETIEEASTSQPVAVDEAERHMQIDTVYSVLQRPKNLKSQHHQQVKQDFQKR
ncbi:uncharacterized protein LOC120797114 [Xiphias gladius]|uniref:uncharacterized protein LOC120797114 n=1 Tax=Xiphias gladius TaxID=8245 RepID=UPI001A98A778|nr:uncharacterized protein LOC120797114 [Xiphias gladius]